MAVVQIHYTERDGSRKLVAPDAVMREAPVLPSEITDFPVERGASISDNIREKPATLTLEFVVTNTPISAPLSHANNATGSYQSAGAGGAGVVLKFSAEFNRVRAMMADLVRVKLLGLMFDIQSALLDYTDFAIENIQTERNDKTGNSAKFVVSFKRINLADTAAVPVPRRVRRTQAPVPQGAQPVVAVRETAAHALAHAILDGSD